MRKIPFYLFLIFIITSCDNEEKLSSEIQALNNPTQTYIINGDIEYTSEITNGLKPQKPIFIYDTPNKTEERNNLTLKTSEHSVSINFGSGIGNPTNSGCKVKRYNNGNSYYTDAGVFGSIPYAYPYPETKSYLVRGYGLPHLNLYYGSLVLFVSNKGKKANTRQGQIYQNDPSGSAISIEYPFKPNITYEISIKVTFHDNRYLIDKVFSSGYPTLYVQLKNDGIIQIPNIRTQSQDPCDKNGLNSVDYPRAHDHANYTRSYTLDSRNVTQRVLTFKFSPTEEKKALLISLHPATSPSSIETPILTNNYTMTMPLINIIERPFDSSINVPVIIRTNPRR